MLCFMYAFVILCINKTCLLDYNPEGFKFHGKHILGSVHPEIMGTHQKLFLNSMKTSHGILISCIIMALDCLKAMQISVTGVNLAN